MRTTFASVCNISLGKNLWRKFGKKNRLALEKGGNSGICVWVLVALCAYFRGTLFLLAVLATTACLLQSGAAAAASTANAETSTGIFNLYRQIFWRRRILCEIATRLSSKIKKIRAISLLKKKIFDNFLEPGRFMLVLENYQALLRWIFQPGEFLWEKATLQKTEYLILDTLSRGSKWHTGFGSVPLRYGGVWIHSRGKDSHIS